MPYEHTRKYDTTHLPRFNSLYLPLPWCRSGPVRSGRAVPSRGPLHMFNQGNQLQWHEGVQQFIADAQVSFLRPLGIAGIAYSVPFRAIPQAQTTPLLTRAGLNQNQNRWALTGAGACFRGLGYSDSAIPVATHSCLTGWTCSKMLQNAQ